VGPYRRLGETRSGNIETDKTMQVLQRHLIALGYALPQFPLAINSAREL
jgi:hypothetical protein